MYDRMENVLFDLKLNMYNTDTKFGENFIFFNVPSF